jgi:hypothetical protein
MIDRQTLSVGMTSQSGLPSTSTYQPQPISKSLNAFSTRVTTPHYEYHTNAFLIASVEDYVGTTVAMEGPQETLEAFADGRQNDDWPQSWCCPC